MKKTLALLPAIFLVALSSHAGNPSLDLAPEKSGAAIDAGSMGKFEFTMPNLILDPKDYEGQKPEIEKQGGALLAHYPCGATLKMVVFPADKSIAFSFDGVPAGAQSFITTMQLPISLSQGGRFAFNQDAFTPFPEQKEKQVLAGTGATRFALMDAMDAGFAVTTPQDYQDVQDNRVFDWSIFVYHFFYTFKDHPGQKNFVIKFESVTVAADSPAHKFLVDRFGQSARKGYPGKVSSEEELKTDVKNQEAALPKPSGPELDAYGGLAGSGTKYGLKKTGFFHVGKALGRSVLVTPDGNPFFQLGVCGIDQTDDYTVVAGREKTYEWVPAFDDPVFGPAYRPKEPGVFSFYKANWIRKFGKPFDPEEWSGQVVRRLRAWGFNSAGAFSGRTKTMDAMRFPRVDFLPLSGAGIKMLPEKMGEGELMDPFAPGNKAALDKAFADEIVSKKNDPLIIGYFLGNEQHVETLPKLIPGYKASEVAAKACLMEILQQKYKDIRRFNDAWKPAKTVEDFDKLGDMPLEVHTAAAEADMREFLRIFMEAYCSMVSRAFHKYDPNHLLIGSRWTPATAGNEDVVRISGKYLDVVSVNYYTYRIERDFLQNVYEWSGEKPILLSEWYYSTTDEGLGGGLEVKNQQERALAYRNYVEQAASIPWVVGSEWFIYGDQSITGRYFQGFNGEHANTGLVNVVDRPYADLVEAAAKTHARIYDVIFGKAWPFAFDDPRFKSKGMGASWN